MNILRKMLRSPTHFRIQYASNLFVDMHNHKFRSLLHPGNNIQVLALLGNIGRPEHPNTRHFLRYCSQNWDRVVWIMGPHEISNKDGEKFMHFEKADRIRQLTESVSNNITLLHQTEVELPELNTVVAGTTLWTNNDTKYHDEPEFNQIYGRMKENKIVPLDPCVYKLWNKEDRDFFIMKKNYWRGMEPNTNLIYLSHHLPVPCLMNRNLSERAQKRIHLDVNNLMLENQFASMWLSGATGSCSTGLITTNPQKQMFIGVNSCFEYPFTKNLTPNKSYLPMLYAEMKINPRKTPIGTYKPLPPDQRLPAITSSIFSRKPLLR